MNEFGNIQGAILNLQGARETQSAYEGKVRTHDFRIPLVKYGIVEDIVCEFAFIFVHQPIFRSELVLDNEAFVFKQYLPTIQATVVDWRIGVGQTEHAGNPTEYAPYFGAKVTATVTGHIYQKAFIHLSFTGRALVVPNRDVRDEAFFTRIEEE